ncbi:MAG: alpha/beta hydrolase fold domain-containing protein [Duncaniella sp.]|uniref:glycosyl hydrolase family 28 protein n=1 Tax=Duncaniella sp. TaxID=2518496 RepID=UPI0023C13F81|nr:glycosyl hydrolase family 28 protein [Duncaniella sp.]MDE6089761.1 alpha/beta hydrolase fold domain-containing protein [Duncaniella sp.]
MKKILFAALIGVTFATSAVGTVPEIPRDTSFTAYSTNIKVRKKHPEAVLVKPELPKGVKAYENEVYTTIKKTKYGDRDLHVDVFRPDDDKVYPALIMIHGGGWNSGDKSLQVPMAQRIAARGYVTIPVEYRLIPEAVYPAGLHDIKTAVRWARANAAKYGIDPDRIAVSGCSAGAHLATLVGVTNGSKHHEGKGQWKDTSSDVQAVINMDGIATFVSESNIADARERFEKKGELPVNALWLGGLYEDSPKNWEEASALLWITPKSAPVCFISSGLPRYSDGRDSLVSIYDSVGIYTERHRIPVDVHPFWFFNPWMNTTVDYASAFLDRMFKADKPVLPRRYRLTDYGVVNDSTVLQTSAIQAVIDRAEAEGGGEVVVPAGTFLTGALFFKPGTSLSLHEGAVIKGSDDIADYPLIPSRMEGRSIYYHAALINAYHVDDFEISGPGTINGNGHRFWVEFWDNVERARKDNRPWTNLEVRRPRLVFLWGCDNARLSGVRLVNSAFWTSHFYRCNDLIIENCEVQAPKEPVRAPSSDAIDLDGCHRVVVRGCYLNCDDDGVCMKGGKGVYANRSYENDSVTDVLVEGCVFGPNLHGTLTLGSECIHADNIVLRNCRVDNDCSVLRLKMRPDTYQVYENIKVENVIGRFGTLIEILPWKQFFTLEGSDEHPVGIIRNVSVSNVSGRCESLGVIAANSDDKVENFTISDVDVKAKSQILRCNYPDVKLVNVLVNGKAPEILTADEEMKDKLNFDATDLDKTNEK